MEAKQVLSHDQFDRYIEDAAKAAGYEGGFGVKNCDLTKPGWWTAYTRQSLEEQSQNNRLPDYLRTCALEAKKLGVVVPREYVLYDAMTGEHLERPDMIRLRRFMAERRIEGVTFPALDRLSREPLHQQIFEVEAAHYGVRVHYADAPNGNDPGSQFARTVLAHAAKLVKLANRKNAVGGNIGRTVKGWVPSCKAAFGYSYRADREITGNGRVLVKKAWWDVDALGPDGLPVEGSAASVVVRIFDWVGGEGRSTYWVANKLNEMGITASEGGKWSSSQVREVVRRRCYTGNHTYNANAKVPNPARPLGDITAEVKRTLTRPKPKEEWAYFKVPALLDESLWEKANSKLSQCGRGKGKQGKTIQALLRNRIFCPRCGQPMVVSRNGRHPRIYYHCSKYFQPWRKDPCGYRTFVPIAWDEVVWGDIRAWLANDEWVEQQLTSEESRDENIAKLVRLQQFKMSQAQARIAKVREGFEAGIYSVADAKRRIAGHEETIAKAEGEIHRLRDKAGCKPSGSIDVGAVREELKALREKNLDEVTFEEKLDIVSILGIKVFPSEDLKSMRVVCQLGLDQMKPRSKQQPLPSLAVGEAHEEREQVGCRKGTPGFPNPPKTSGLWLAEGDSPPPPATVSEFEVVRRNFTKFLRDPGRIPAPGARRALCPSVWLPPE